MPFASRISAARPGQFIMTVYKAFVSAVIAAFLVFNALADPPSTKAAVRRGIDKLWSTLQK